jgi:hypothetical protein
LLDATAEEILESGEADAGGTEAVVAETVASFVPEGTVNDVEEGAVEDEEMRDFAPGDVDD